MKKQFDRRNPISVFYSYALEDEELCNDLDKHLSLLQRNGIITTWHNRQILPGTDWAHMIDRHMNEASLILLLISPDFLASDYCYAVEMQRALERHKNNEARVIPIILRPVDWDEAPFAHLQCLPLDGKPVTTWKNRDAAFLQIAKGIRDAIKDLSISNHSTASSDRYRQRLLKTVQSIWITGVFDHSLYGTNLIALNIYEQPDAIDNPWQEIVQETKQSPKPLTPGMGIMQVYSDADGDLLILGRPGSGKTTQLLELARNLLDRARQDMSHPIPVVLHASSYYDKRKKEDERKKQKSPGKTLAEWIVEELDNKYNIPRKVGEAWVKNDQILPLLDGLDEGEERYQVEYIGMVNTWKREHKLLPLVACSRFSEYMTRENRLQLQKAIMIQPLTNQQIDMFFLHRGESSKPLYLALQHDSELRELISTPLMLNMLILVHEEIEVEEPSTSRAKQKEDLSFPKIGQKMGEITESPFLDPDLYQQFFGKDFFIKDLSKLREQVLYMYVQKMLHRRRSSSEYPPEKVINWLSLLARWSSSYNKRLFCAPSFLLLPPNLYKSYLTSVEYIGIALPRIIGIAALATLGLSIATTLLHWLIFPFTVLLGIESLIFTILGATGYLWAYAAFTNSFLFSVTGKRSFSHMLLYCIFFLLGLIVTSLQYQRDLFLSSLLIPISVISGIALCVICIRLHSLIIRVLLCWNGHMPWNYQPFLRYAVERILFHNVGKEYTFIHPLLHQYFDELNTDHSHLISHSKWDKITSNTQKNNL